MSAPVRRPGPAARHRRKSSGTNEMGDTLARIRSLKPEFWQDRKLARLCTRDARMLYMALWNLSDEHGRLLGDPRSITGLCFPFDDDLDPAAIDRLLGELIAAGRVVRYEVDGDPYLYLPKLAKHQRLEPAKVPSRLPPPPPAAGPDGTPPAGPSEPRADESGPRADESAPRADECAPSYVAGSRDQGSGSRDQVAGESRVLPVGQLADRNARARRAAPSAQPRSTSKAPAPSFQARSTIFAIPRYRAAPGWVRRRLAAAVDEALRDGYGRDAIVHYAQHVVEPGRFKDHQHIPEFRDALRRLRQDVALGTVCACCGVPPAGCEARRAAADRPWTPEDQADLERACAHLGVPVPLARGA